MNPIEVLIDHDYEGERVDKYLSVIFPDSSRAALQKAVEAGNADAMLNLLKRVTR